RVAMRDLLHALSRIQADRDTEAYRSRDDYTDFGCDLKYITKATVPHCFSHWVRVDEVEKAESQNGCGRGPLVGGRKVPGRRGNGRKRNGGKRGQRLRGRGMLGPKAHRSFMGHLLSIPVKPISSWAALRRNLGDVTTAIRLA
ncbi:hypothetical protein ALC62_01548, partial [Cyphomyrmex costatus]